MSIRQPIEHSLYSILSSNKRVCGVFCRNDYSRFVLVFRENISEANRRIQLYEQMKPMWSARREIPRDRKGAPATKCQAAPSRHEASETFLRPDRPSGSGHQRRPHRAAIGEVREHPTLLASGSILSKSRISSGYRPVRGEQSETGYTVERLMNGVCGACGVGTRFSSCFYDVNTSWQPTARAISTTPRLQQTRSLAPRARRRARDAQR